MTDTNQPPPSPQRTFVDLGAQHTAEIEAFRCRTPFKGSGQAERLIRGHLPQTLLDPKFNIFGVGVIDAGGSIAGLSAWEITETNGKFVWVNHVLGVHTDFQRQRIGYDLKSEVLARARSAGAIAVTSVVHDANKPMLDLNRKLGATTEPDSERKHTLCTIALRPG